MLPAKTPRILWVELTSKCPFDCVFCSRKSRRGSGEHMPYPLFESLVRQVSDPRTVLLNYSGESTIYPELIPAIRLARSTGAAVELVSALASASDALIEQLASSGLTRLTVSIHAADAAAYDGIYRYGALATLRARLERLVMLCRGLNNPPAIDLAFVAMEQNLAQLGGVADLASGLELRAIHIFPVIRRDEIPETFPRELTILGTHRAEFREELNRRVSEARMRHPGIAFTICNPLFTNSATPLGEAPAACPGELPGGASIHSCEQNPWETAHVLSNGDVVACEVHDRQPLGNLARQPLAEIWHGEAYRRFRESYRAGELAACRSCPWKTAHIPAAMRSEILAARGRSAQMSHGWHEPEGEPQIWASQQAVASIEPRAGSRTLHVNGLLPPGLAGQPNELNVSCNELHVGTVANATAGMLPFGVDIPIPAPANRPWELEFRTRFVYRPKERGTGSDQRDLGFALRLLASQPPVNGERALERRPALSRLLNAVRAIDRLGRMMRLVFRAPHAPEQKFAPGVSVVIPERDNAGELALCLAGVRAAARRWDEPIETLVVVNGAQPGRYGELQAMYPEVRWQFHAKPLGFGRAVEAGVTSASYDWVYLLNSDVVLEADALATAGRHRDTSVFSIASQIVLKDVTRFRDETNWTALFIEDGLATTHDLIPSSARTVEHFYAGGGASLFQRRLLQRVMDSAAYHPFYWEDVEWGWRARKLGRRSLFCGDSVARHTQRATISRFFSPAEIEAIVERNRLLFQLRNFTTVGSLDAVAEAIARARPEVADQLLDWHAIGVVTRGRLWNHAAPRSDEEVLASSQTASAGGAAITRSAT